MSSTFAVEYAAQLADLTFNSKPLITALSQIAGEHIGDARSVVDAILRRIAVVRRALFSISLSLSTPRGQYTDWHTQRNSRKFERKSEFLLTFPFTCRRRVLCRFQLTKCCRSST
jgi:hypothetical protein